MEGLRQRSKAALSLQREFSGSRLEEQILRRVFELISPVLAQRVKESEPLNSAADRVPVSATQSQGA
jgi:hypothetical protein